MTPETLAELRRLHDAATPGPWGEACGDVIGLVPHPTSPEVIGHFTASPDVVNNGWDYNTTPPTRLGVMRSEDQTLIVAMRNALPSLLAAAEREAAMREVVDAARGAVASASGTIKERTMLPCRVDEMTPREHAIFVVASEWCAAVGFIEQHLRAALDRLDAKGADDA